jgi:hypothetical protein
MYKPSMEVLGTVKLSFKGTSRPLYEEWRGGWLEVGESRSIVWK